MIMGLHHFFIHVWCSFFIRSEQLGKVALSHSFTALLWKQDHYGTLDKENEGGILAYLVQYLEVVWVCSFIHSEKKVQLFEIPYFNFKQNSSEICTLSTLV